MSTMRSDLTGGFIAADRAQLNQEFQHIRSRWCWLFPFGVLLIVCGTVAVIVPAITVTTTLVAMIVLGVSLMVGGIATIIASFWAGKWSGVLLQLLVGIFYLVAGYVISDRPLAAATFMAA